MINFPLLKTKLYCALPDIERVQRSRLLVQLDRGLLLGNRLLLVCAPAGYGKTTLVSEWLQTTGRQAAWLSLDEADNDPNLFLAYLAAAFQQVDLDLGLAPHAYLQAAQSIALQPVFADWINILAVREMPLILVLDDYQFITNPAIHDGVAFLLDHLPAQVHLLLATRSDPPLPLHRYRARREMVEIRASDLRFSPEETGLFISQIVGFTLGRDEIDVLDERIEGWAAGIQMAALSFERHPELSNFIQSLAGSSRYILDYLAEEVLNNQAEDLRRFLLQISILERFCASLCDAITGSVPGASEAHIETIRGSNLFLSPLDAAEQWFRFHALFSDLLRVRLMQPQSGIPGAQIRELHRRASVWYEKEGYLRDAIHHALQALDYERAADLVEGNAVTLLGRGELHALLSWLDRLPRQTAEGRPWLCIYQAWALGFNGQPDEAGRMLRLAEQILAGDHALSAVDVARLRYEIYAVQMMAAVSSGREVDFTHLEKMFLAPPPEGQFFAYSAICWAWGYTCRSAGQMERAAAAFEKMRRAGMQIGNSWTVNTATVDLGNVLRLRGQLKQSIQVYRQGLEAFQRKTTFAPGFIGRLESLMSIPLIEQNDLAQARQLVEAAQEHNRWWHNPNHDTHALIAQALVLLAEGNLPAVQVSLERAGEIIAREPVVQLLRSQLEAVWVQYWLASGQMAVAEEWGKDHAALMEVVKPGEPQVFRQLALARIWLATGRKQQALSLLHMIGGFVEATGRIASLIEILALRSLAQEDPDLAQADLRQALELGEPQGFTRVFLDLGEPMRRLLSAVRSPAGVGLLPTPVDAYVQSLLDAFPSKESEAQVSGVRDPLDALVERLTDREYAVLRCMAEGLTNPQIGGRLYISTGTVKAHSASIFRKLEVANRTEAVARAKDLHLL